VANDPFVKPRPMTERTPFIAVNKSIVDRIFDQQQLALFELFKLLELIKTERARRAADRKIGDNIEFHPAPRHRRQKCRQIARQHDGVGPANDYSLEFHCVTVAALPAGVSAPQRHTPYVLASQSK